MTEKAKKEIIITGILFAVLIFISIRSCAEIKQKRGTRPKTQKAVPLDKAILLQAKKIDSAQEYYKVKENFANLESKVKGFRITRDIFVLGQLEPEEEISPTDLALYGIIWDEDNPIAVINEEIMKTGDKIGNNTIVKIEQDGVIVNDGKKDYKLRLYIE